MPDGQAPQFGADEVEAIRSDLLDWYDRHRRDLPWRDIDDPYRTWVAEMMLQQTQVTTVIDYYRRWMERFPDVASVAQADIDEVLELWQGLGYYRRARFLHRSARMIVEEYDGELPSTVEGLKTLVGVGPYTAGAIASIAFDRAVPLVDGNVERVLSRLRSIEGDPKSSENQSTYWRLAEDLVDPQRPGDFNQGLMELGATICTPQNPNCLICPVRQACQGFESGDPQAFPEPVERTQKKPMSVAVSVVSRPAGSDGAGPEVLLMKRPEEGLLAGLWEVPTVELDAEPDAPSDAVDAVIDYLRDGVGLDATESLEEAWLGTMSHLFSHIDMTLHIAAHHVPADISLSASQERPMQWVRADDCEDVAMSAAGRKVLSRWREQTSAGND
jgi:A/G-specific adenine glycosylase